MKSGLDQESKYEKTVSLFAAMDSMLLCNEKVKMYEELEQQFYELIDFLDAKEYAEECGQLAKKTAIALEKSLYKKATIMKKEARKEEDYRSAAEEFHKLGNYKDSKELAEQCEILSSQISKRTTINNIVKIGFTILLIIVASIFTTTSHAKYYYANVCSFTGSYQTAIQMYKKLGAYKDCEERLAESRYQYALNAERSGDYLTAEKNIQRLEHIKIVIVKELKWKRS